MQDDTNRITSGVHRLSSVMGRIADRALQQHFGFGMTQFKILWVLWHHQEGVRQSDIAMWLNQTEAAISRQMRPMSDQKLLESKVDPKNRRSHIVCLTDKGKELCKKAMDVMVAEHQPFISLLSKAQQKDLADMLETLFKGACAADGKSLKPSEI